MQTKPPKPKPCKVCRTVFQPRSMKHVVCGYDCSVEFVRQKDEIKKRKEQRDFNRYKKARLQELRPLRDCLKAAQEQYNRARRFELMAKGYGCMSCGRSQEEVVKTDGWKPGGAWDCGHFLSRAAYPALRYTPDNTWLQCKSCNGGSAKYAKKAHTVGLCFRLALIDEIGLARVEELEASTQTPKWDRDELARIETECRAKANALEKASK